MALFNVFRAENYLNSEKWWGGGRGGGERVFSHGKQSFLSRKCISCGAISLPSCNGFNGDVIFGWVNDVIGPVICIFCTFFKP